VKSSDESLVEEEEAKETEKNLYSQQAASLIQSKKLCTAMLCAASDEGFHDFLFSSNCLFKIIIRFL
jgi:hypothetical protein